MKRIFVFLLLVYCFCGCQKHQRTNDLAILNQIFPQLTKEMKLSIVEPIAFPPSLPYFIYDDTMFNDIYPDTCINRGDIASYLKTLEEYHFYLQNYYFENYAFRSDSIEAILGISDTLYPCLNCFNYENDYVIKEIPDEYLFVFSDTSEYESDLLLDKNKLTNTGVFKICNISDLKWNKKNNREFWNTQRDYFISGILMISRIYYNKSMDHGVFFCTRINSEVEPYPLIICVKLQNNKWEIDKAIFRM